MVLVRDATGITSVGDLAGARRRRRQSSSPQSRLIPLAHLEAAGIDPAATQVRRFDVMVGKHGDHVGSERDAVLALTRGEVDAACIIGRVDLLAFTRRASSPPVPSTS